MSGFLGISCLASGLWMLLFPASWKVLVLEKICPERRPTWLVYVAGIGIVWSLATWGMYFGAPSLGTLVVTLFMTFGILKGGMILFRYEYFRAFVITLVDGSPKTLTWLQIGYFVLGAGLLLLSLVLS